jgi:hypothetical protein
MDGQFFYILKNQQQRLQDSLTVYKRAKGIIGDVQSIFKVYIKDIRL